MVLLIDSYMVAKISSGEWKNISFLPTSLTKSIIGSEHNKKKKKSFTGYRIKHTFTSGLLFVPYNLDSHWYLLVANISKKELMVFDPLSKNNSSDRAELFKKYLINYKTLKPNNKCNLTKLEWTIVSTSSVNIPFQEDSYNCGLYVLHYMDHLANGNINSSAAFDADKFRIQVSLYLLAQSLPMTEVCLGCSKDAGELLYVCSNCRRKLHEKCTNLYFFKDIERCIFCNHALVIQRGERFLSGFPNPIGSNSCWFNASLQLIMSLVPFDHFDSLKLTNSSELIDNFKCLRKCLNMGLFGSHNIGNILA